MRQANFLPEFRNLQRRIAGASVLVLAVLVAACADGPEEPLQEARSLQEAGRVAESIPVLESVLNETPDDREANHLLGSALLATGQPALAIWPLSKAAEAPDAGLEDDLLLGRAHLRGGSAMDALAVAHRLVEKAPDLLEARQLRIEAFMESNDFEEALADADFILDLRPDDQQTLVTRISILFELERAEEAEEAIATAKKAFTSVGRASGKPNPWEARLCAVDATFQFEKRDEGHIERARSAWEACLAEFPTVAMVLSNAMPFFDGLGEPQRSLEILRSAVEQAPENVDFRIGLGMRLGAMGEDEEAEKTLREAAESSNQPGPWITLAEFHDQRMQLDAARAATEKALGLMGEPSVVVQMQYADLLIRAGDYDAAEKAGQAIEKPEYRSLLEGHGVDWPIRYRDIEPWYDHVEEFIGVSGRPEGLTHLPDGNFLPPMEFNCVEAAVKERIESKFSDRIMTIGRAAVLTEDHKGRAACHYCGPCERGCSTGSYFSTQSSTLPAAMKTGRLEVQTDSIVERVEYDPRARRATGVHVIDAVSNERRFVAAKLIFLCASTLGTAQILLNSRTEQTPNGLANSSGVVGRYLMDHTFAQGAIAIMPGFEDAGSIGHRPNGTYIPRFRNVDSAHDGFVRGYGYQGGASRLGWGMMMNQTGFGSAWKNALTRPGPWMMMLAGFGECLPNEVNRARLSETHKDRWGIPQLDIHLEWSDNERAMCKDMTAQAIAMLEAAGGVEVMPLGGEPTPGGMAIHEMGTARMGRDPRTSVLNAHNQAHDVPNLFVTDGSAMTSSACQNPSLTYMALTARACAYAVKELRGGGLA